MKRSKDKFYMKQIFDCISDGEIIATGKIAKEIGLSEKLSLIHISEPTRH